jgi:hypothetical protein
VLSLDGFGQGTVLLMAQWFPLDQLLADATNNFVQTFLRCLENGLFQHAKLILERYPANCEPSFWFDVFNPTF